MALTSEQMFYEVMWRAWARQLTYPISWWVQQTLRRWIEAFDGGLFDSKEAAFASNALYRYWNMIGVKDHVQESLVGQVGEIEPVYEAYAVFGFVFEPDGRRLHLPHLAEPDRPLPAVTQRMDSDYLPVVLSTYRTDTGIVLDQKAMSTTVGVRQRDVVLDRLSVSAAGGPRRGWLCLAVLPSGPSSFQRHDRAGRYLPDRQISFLRYNQAENRVEVNTGWGPIFDTVPASFGVYGNPGSSSDPDSYLTNNPFQDLVTTGALNGADTATDMVASMCTGVFAWPFDLAPAATFQVDVRLPVDDYRGGQDLAEIRAPSANTLEAANRAFWTGKLDGEGLQLRLPPLVAHLFNLFRLCRANLLILADSGAIHPGPTIYDSFWVRDSSVEGITCALTGDTGLAATQFGQHYPTVFNQGDGQVGPARVHGFFGGDHEKNDQEWDSNGEALWAFGRFDRISGPAAFGARMFSPYVVEGARWIRDNRSAYGLLLSGWSAEHIGDRDKPHYWDDFWGVTGLYEAARLAERIGAAETGELWAALDDLRRATAESIRWVLGQQHAAGLWETFIPTGPGDVGRLDSTMIGSVAYFHPCRLYMGSKLGADIDQAARMTLETIWARFVRDGGFRHDAAWYAYGPYLTLQLAHAFLFIGDITRMDACLRWVVGNAGYPHVTRYDGAPDRWQVVQGCWNEQHAYPIATDFRELPGRWWYMGDIPHGWAAAEFNLLLRDITFFEADEDGTPHVYLTPGVPPHWLTGGGQVTVTDAPTLFGVPLGFILRHDDAARTVTIEVTQRLPNRVSFIYPCRLGPVQSATADGQPLAVAGADVPLPAGFQHAMITYG